MGYGSLAFVGMASPGGQGSCYLWAMRVKARGRDESMDMSLHTRHQIETDRLVLSRPSLDDFDAYHALFAEPLVYRFFGNEPPTRNESWTKFLRGIGHWSVFGFGMFSIRERATGTYLGETGLIHFQRELGPEFDSCAEAVWILASSAHGKGYATEAAGAAMRWIFDRQGERRTVCLIDPENTGSVRVAEKLGFLTFGQRTYRDKPVTLFERPPRSEVPTA